MRAYIYQADLYCEGCGEAIKTELALPPGYDPENESSYDSDDYPKGPYDGGGGEADAPQHCGRCGVFLENPLTAEGFNYIETQIEDAGNGDRSYPRPAHDPAVLRRWAEFYEIDVWTAGWNLPGCLPETPPAAFAGPYAEWRAREYLADVLDEAADGAAAVGDVEEQREAEEAKGDILAGAVEAVGFRHYAFWIGRPAVSDVLGLQIED